MIVKSSSQLLMYLSEEFLVGFGGRFPHQRTMYTPKYRLDELKFKLLAPWGLSVWEE